MGLGYVEGVTHDDFRHGTTALFAALDVATENTPLMLAGSVKSNVGLV